MKSSVYTTMEIERVSRKDIRSCTPCVEGSDNQEIGRVVEGSGLCRRPDHLSAVIPCKKVSKVLSLSARNKFLGDDHLAAQENTTDEKYVHNSLNIVSDGYCALRQTKRSDYVGYFITTSTESSDSVGSCSINDKFSNCSPVEVYCQGTELLCSDAESFRNSADKEERHPLSSPEKIAASIHSLELHAYRCTLEALYASGPLSWDQEALLTNLRISLHISNDEHLAELRTLISAGTGIHGNSWMLYILCLQKSKDDACICSSSPATSTVPKIRQFVAFCCCYSKASSSVLS
ncbi:uncharacterized protein [Nicotiana tomentosiformis]|uniref:uncharacterized protein isoform X2 n=1 Tax=Nicotiana tomentosiformis TaxID=4098 RepID=UPI00388CEC93